MSKTKENEEYKPREINYKNLRYAYEWYVDEGLRIYNNLALSYANEVKKLTTKLIGVSLIVNVIITIFLICLLYKCQ